MKALNILLCAGVAFLLEPVIAVPAAHAFPPDISLFNTSTFNHELQIAKRADKVPLRILSIGASIVYGIGSSNGNGFRKPLRDQLRWLGYEVNMVGTQRNGPMTDNDVEARPGATIDQVKALSKNSLKYKPNVVLINAGMNDCTLKVDPGNAGARMRTLIDELLSASGMDRTVVILSTLIYNDNVEGNYCRDNAGAPNGGINRQYRALVYSMQAQGKKVLLADMDPLPPHAGRGWIKYPEDFADGTHPNDVGFKKMAYVFYAAIENAAARNWLQAPHAITIGGVAPPGCRKKAGDGIDAGGQTQRGSGQEDGIYTHKSQEMGIKLVMDNNDFDRNQWFFARLFSRDRDDLLEWYTLADGVTVRYRVWKNNGDGNFARIGDLNVADNCIPAGVNFIDVNADGLDDFVCVAPQGNAYASINQRNGNGNTPPTFNYIGLWKSSQGYNQDRIRLADIDGDGRADYCALDDGGNVWCWRNGWINDKPAYWQALGKRFDAKGMGDMRGVRFEDINGDGRDDWLWVDDVGKTFTWTNSRSCRKGSLGDGLNVAWRQGFRPGATEGPTHLGMGGFASSGLRKRIFFARIYGQPSHFGGLGLQDYVFMEHISLANGKHKFQMRVWKNVGGGGTKVKADGVKYCNMKGNRGGAVDYVWTHSTGKMTLYPSRGLSRISVDQPWWGMNLVIWDPVALIGRSLDRRDLHLVDWDGDGFCDIVWVDPNNQNRPQLWRNKYGQTGRWEWDYNPNPAPSLYCPERRGLGIHDLPVRFADVNGNGRGDYLCIEKDGRVWGFLHESDGSWRHIPQFKSADGRDRANLRWADANGDGRDDMIWTDKFNGDGWVYYNIGPSGNPAQSQGSSWLWDKPSTRSYSGNAAGTCTYYHDMDGDGRADQHILEGTFTNTARTSLNTCGGGTEGSGDDGPRADPGLPVMPAGQIGGDYCVGGSGPDSIGPLCSFTCQYDFCPSPCTCTAYGPRPTVPADTNSIGYPALGRSSEYMEVCAFACAKGFCPSSSCTYTRPAIFREDREDFNPDIEPDRPAGCDDLESVSMPWKCFVNKVGDDSSCEVYASSNSPAMKWRHYRANECIEDLAAWFAILKHSGNTVLYSESMPTAIGMGWGGMKSKYTRRVPTPNYCDIIGSQDCQTFECGTTQYVALDMVLRSIRNLFSFHTKLYDAIDEAQGDLTLACNKLPSAFIPQTSSALDIIKQIAKTFDSIFSVATMGSWGLLFTNQAFKHLLGITQGVNDLKTTVVSSYHWYGFHGAAGMTAFEQAMSRTVSCQNAVYEITKKAKESLDKTHKWLLSSGDDYAMYALPDILRDGRFLEDPAGLLSKNDFAKKVGAAITAKLIQRAWTREEGQAAVILIDNNKDVQNPGAGKPVKVRDFSMMQDSVASATRMVYDGVALWLVYMHDGPVVENHMFRKLKGMDEIDDDGNDWGVNWKELVKSSYDGWKANNRANPYGPISTDKLREYPAGSPDSADFLPVLRGVGGPGFINIPVCSIDVAYRNWEECVYSACGTKCPHYPCCDM